MKKVDIIFGAIIGEAVAWYFLLAFKELGALMEKFGIPGNLTFFILPVLFPILAIIGLWFANIIGKKFLFIFQIAKFFLMGALVTLIDVGILNILMRLSGFYTGNFYTIFKGISSLIAFLSKFFGAKLWVFEKTEKEKQIKEFGGFIIVSLIGIAINVAAASFIVRIIGPQFGLSKESWANIGAIGAAFVSLGWNFLGSKFFVFKK